MLEVVVCVAPTTRAFPSEGSSDAGGWRYLGELDLLAVELASSLEAGGVRTTAVSVGPADRVGPALTECLARGIGRAIQVDGGAVDDSYAVGRLLADAIRPIHPDLILCGQRSDAGAHGVVHAVLADALAVPSVSSVVDLDVDWTESRAQATQMIERGGRWKWEAPLPFVCAVERDVVSPRYLPRRRFARALASVVRDEPLTASPEAAEAAQHEFGGLVISARGPLRIRPKKSKAPPKQMSAADRMKFLRSGGQAARPAESDGPRRITGTPEEAAREIVAFLEKEELL